MKNIQVKITNPTITNEDLSPLNEINPNLILIFGSLSHFKESNLNLIKEIFPNSEVLGCSTSGEIGKGGVFDNSLVITGIEFSNPDFKTFSTQFKGMDDSEESGKRIGSLIKDENLSSIFLLAPGVNINGSTLIDGLRSEVGDSIIITGGLAGDQGNFTQTYTIIDGSVSSENVVALGVYNNSISIGHGSAGGWETFGPVREISKADGNILYELDNTKALDIYKKYLGNRADELPASGLLFPLSMVDDGDDNAGVIRTILGVDEEEGSITLAGSVDEGKLVRLMHAENEGLVEGARKASALSKKTLKNEISNDSVAVLISCIGRKLVLGDEVDEEIESVEETLGNITVTGFYSNGEICPVNDFQECKLHNQTMTITIFNE